MQRNADMFSMLEIMSALTHEMAKLNTSELSYNKVKEILKPIVEIQMKKQIKM